MKNIPPLLFCVLFFAVRVLAQGPGSAAVPFLLIGPSPGLGGSQGANAVLPTDDSFGSYYNPAQLGIFSKDNNFAYQFYPVKMNWLPKFNFNDLTLNSSVSSCGIKLENLINETELFLGVSYLQTRLNLGKSTLIDENNAILGTFHSNESYNAFSIGIGLEKWATFSFGYTYKRITSKLANNSANGTAYDLGVMVSAPLLKDYLNSSESALYINDQLVVFSNACFGYSLINNGDFFSYKDGNTDLLPKTARLGLGISLGLLLDAGHTHLKFVELEFANEASDLLIASKDSIHRSYQNGIGDINLIDNVILGNSDNLVQARNSLRINFAESFSAGFHQLHGSGYPGGVRNITLSISTKGLFRYFDTGSHGEFINYLFKHLDFRYSQSAISSRNSNPIDGTRNKSLSVHLRNFF